jgi:predicted anti-sigma-YlaC factor YlaD
MPNVWNRLLRRDRPMDCHQVAKVLQRYLDGQLDSRRAARLAGHLEDCKRCGLDADTYERIKRSLAERRATVPPDSLARLREFGERLARGDQPIGH